MIRLGEQELVNLLLGNDDETVYAFLNAMSSNREDREKLIKETLNGNIFDIKITKSEDKYSSEILQAYLSAIGLRLISSSETESMIVSEEDDNFEV